MLVHHIELQKLKMYNNAFRKEFVSMAKKHKLIP